MKPEELVVKIKGDLERQNRVLALEQPQLGVRMTRWIVEGDVGLSEERLLPYAAERIEIANRLAGGDKSVQIRGLVAIESGGKILRWSPGKVLDYCVYRPSFTSDDEYRAVVRDMRFATAEWSNLCGVNFLYRPELDAAPDFKLGDVTFPVVRQRGGGSTIAMAFFPDEPVEERIVWIFDGHFDPQSAFDPVGVLRHELGHALGFRHEHIRPEAADLFSPESTEHTKFITEYDPKSVMHYVAVGLGDPKLRFTDLDRSGASRIYGAPLSDFKFVEP